MVLDAWYAPSCRTARRRAGRCSSTSKMNHALKDDKLRETFLKRRDRADRRHAEELGKLAQEDRRNTPAWRRTSASRSIEPVLKGQNAPLWRLSCGVSVCKAASCPHMGGNPQEMVWRAPQNPTEAQALKAKREAGRQEGHGRIRGHRRGGARQDRETAGPAARRDAAMPPGRAWARPPRPNPPRGPSPPGTKPSPRRQIRGKLSDWIKKQQDSGHSY